MLATRAHGLSLSLSSGMPAACLAQAACRPIFSGLTLQTCVLLLKPALRDSVLIPLRWESRLAHTMLNKLLLLL